MIPLRPTAQIQSHAPTHATGGTDPLTPEAIGAASEFYAENLAQDATNAAFAHTNSAISSHLSAQNPHQITPTLIGAAAASHVHAENQIQSQSIIFEPGWQNYSAPWGNCQVSLLNNTVRLRGLIASVSPNTRLLSILPEIYRPNQHILLNCIARTLVVPAKHIVCALEITPNGNFSIHDITMVPINDIIWINITSSFIKS